MGWAFTATIPLASIRSAETTSERVFEVGVHGNRNRWLVNGSRKGLVKLTIDPSAQARVWRKSVKVSSLVLSVTDPEALIAACTAPAQ
jgi:hypothetical protein